MHGEKREWVVFEKTRKKALKESLQVKEWWRFWFLEKKRDGEILIENVLKKQKDKEGKWRENIRERKQQEKGSEVGVGQFCSSMIITCFIFSHFTLFYLASSILGSFWCLIVDIRYCACLWNLRLFLCVLCLALLTMFMNDLCISFFCFFIWLKYGFITKSNY